MAAEYLPLVSGNVPDGAEEPPVNACEVTVLHIGSSAWVMSPA